MSITVRRRADALLTLLVLAAVAGCGGGQGPLAVRAPTPEGKTAEACEALHDVLPEEIDGAERRELEPDTPYAAAWGEDDAAIVLRCGMGRPDVLAPGSDSYQPNTDAVMVNEVSWLIEHEGEGYRFTTTERTVWVEVVVPDALAPDAGVLVEFAEPVGSTIPLDPLWEDYYHEEDKDRLPEDGGGD